MHTLPVLVPDQNVSRNLKKHFLWMPGDDNPLVFNTIADAIDAILATDHKTFALATDSGTYHCRHTDLALYRSHKEQPDNPFRP